MRKIKIITVGLLCVGLVVITFSQLNAEKTKTLHWFHYETDPKTQPVMTEIAEAYEREHPEVKVEIEAVGETDASEKLAVMIMAGHYPELAQTSTDNCAFWAAEDMLVPLEDIANAYGDFAPSGLGLNTYKGRVYGLAWSLCTQLMYYRTDWFKEQGVEVPQTWEEQLAAAKKLTLDVDGDGTVDRYGIHIPVGAAGQSAEVFIQLLWQQGSTLFDRDHNWNLANPEPAKAAETVLEYFRALAKYNPPGAAMWTYADSNLAFTADKPAASFLYGRVITYIDRYAPQLVSEVSAYPLPKGKKRASVLWGEPWVVFKDSDDPEEGKNFLEFWFRDDNYQKYLAVMPVVTDLPIRETIAESAAYVEHPLRKAFAEVQKAHLEALKYGVSITLETFDEPNPYLWPVWEAGVMQDMVQMTVLKGMDPSEVVKWSIGQAEEVLAR